VNDDIETLTETKDTLNFKGISQKVFNRFYMTCSTKNKKTHRGGITGILYKGMWINNLPYMSY
jgi:hypothetical protein